MVRKLLAFWFATYGILEMRIVNQGGEFSGASITMCEEIFGPVLTIYTYPADQFEATLDLVDRPPESS
jgi:hypothetical protein